MRGSTNDLRYWKDGTRIRPTPEDESEYARFGTFPSWPGPKPDVFISGFCLCGHHWSEHHDDRAECEFYGSNEEGGLDAQGWRHCFRYVDKEQTDERAVRDWRKRRGPRSGGDQPVS